MSGSIKLLKRNMHCEGRAIGIAVSTSGSNSADLILHSYMVNICEVLPEWSYRVRRNLYVNPIKSSEKFRKLPEVRHFAVANAMSQGFGDELVSDRCICLEPSPVRVE